MAKQIENCRVLLKFSIGELKIVKIVNPPYCSFYSKAGHFESSMTSIKKALAATLKMKQCSKVLAATLVAL